MKTLSFPSSTSSTSLYLVVGSLAAVGCIALATYRTVLASRRPAARARPASLARLPAILSSLHASCDAMAARLAAALRLRTVSFETAEGNAASLLPGAAPGARSCGGCGCCAPGGGGASASASADARVSPSPEALDESRAAFLALHALLAASFPRLHARLERHVVNTYSLVYVWWPAAAADARQPAVALAAHLDVVPVPDAAEWAHAPFGGVIAGGFVHGRGAIDDKHALMTICEAVEALLAHGFEPRRPVVLAFGHDEELGGMDGAAAIARALPGLLQVGGKGKGGCASGKNEKKKTPTALPGANYASRIQCKQTRWGWSRLPPPPPPSRRPPTRSRWPSSSTRAFSCCATSFRASRGAWRSCARAKRGT
jgi:hypothetical protein